MTRSAVESMSGPQRQAHFKALGALKRENHRHEKARNSTITKDLGLNYMHLRPFDKNGETLQNGGITLAWRRVNTVGTIVEIAAVFCHRHDAYCRHVGRVKAAYNMVNGASIRLRFPTSRIVTDGLREMFTPLAVANSGQSVEITTEINFV